MTSGISVWTSWKVCYVVVIMTWACVIFSNYMSTKDDFDAVKAALGDDMGGDNWVHVAGALGLGSTCVLILTVLYGVARDPGKWQTNNDIGPSMARLFMHLSNELVSLCVISVVSVYLYLHEGEVKSNVSGAPWVVVLGVIMFVMIIIDRVIFSPALLYIEIMSSPCFMPCSSNTRASGILGETTLSRSAYYMYFERLFCNLPRLSRMYSECAHVKGVPLTELRTELEPASEDHVQAARELVVILNRKYKLTI